MGGHLDEVLTEIDGEPKYLWRTVDQDVGGSHIKAAEERGDVANCH
jgi:hypothetical protein